MMKKSVKVSLLTALSTAFAFSAIAGVAVNRMTASAEGVTTNDGKTTDWVDYWWGGGVMSSVLNDKGETVITLPNTSYGHRMNNGKDINGTGTDIYTAKIDYTMSTETLGFFAFATSGSQYLANESLAVCLKGEETKEDGTKTSPVVLVGLSHEAYDYHYEIGSAQNVHFELECSKLNADGGIAVSLKINGTEHRMEFEETYLQTRFGSVRALDEVFGGWDGTTTVTVHSYSDSYRDAYLDEVGELYDTLSAKIKAVDFSKISSSATVAELVEVKKYSIMYSSEISEGGFRNREKTLLNRELTAIDAAVDSAIGSNESLANMVTIAANVEVFSEKVEAGLETKDKAAAAESLKQAVDLDALNDLIDDSEYSDYATMVKQKYTAARNTLSSAKDALVLSDIVAFEAAVEDLSTDEKIVAAGDLKNLIVLSDALAANTADYEARVNAAAKKLGAALQNYAGDLAKSWDIYNVTFVKANENGGIDVSATDYYDDNPSTDVGLSFRDKFQLDGFSVEFTYTGPTGANVWLGLHFFSELDVMHISDTDAFAASTGITTLIVPKEAATEFQMGYPKLYGNCPAGGWPSVDVGTVGTLIKVRFEKDSAAGVYNCYVTMGEGEEKLLCSMDAGILETYLVDGYGYFNMGYCDKDLNVGHITIHKINGKNAATLVAENQGGENRPDNPDDPDNSGNNSSSGSETDKPESSGSEGGCGSVVGISAACAVLLCGGALFVVKRRRE